MVSHFYPNILKINNLTKSITNMKIPTIQFIFDRKKTASIKKKGTVEMRITFNRVRKHLSTGVSVYAGQWDAAHEVVTNALDAHYMNSILSEMRLKAMKIITAMVERGRIDLDEIPAKMRQKATEKTFPEYIYERMGGKQVADSTKKAYHVFFARFSAWGGMEHFSDVNEKNIRDFDEYLHAFRWKEKDRFGREVERRYSQSSIGSMHKNLKAFINDAIVSGYVSDNPYSSKRIKIDKGGTRVDHFLTREELERIEQAKLPTKSLNEARDLFLMQACTGMSYIDLMTFDFEEIKDKETYSVCTGKRQKTGIEFSFVLTPSALRILKNYSFHLPKTTNQQYNTRLKLLADAAGIDKPLTSHDARRTCGYTLLNAGVPIAVVSRVLGHSSIKMTETSYAKVLDDTVAKELKDHPVL